MSLTVTIQRELTDAQVADVEFLLALNHDESAIGELLSGYVDEKLGACAEQRRVAQARTVLEGAFLLPGMSAERQAAVTQAIDTAAAIVQTYKDERQAAQQAEDATAEEDARRAHAAEISAAAEAAAPPMKPNGENPNA